MQATRKSVRWPYLVLAVFTLVLVCLLSGQLVTRYATQQAYTDLRREDLARARVDLDTANNWSGFWLTANDSKRIAIAEGDYAIQLAESATNVTGFLEEMERAEQHYSSAVAIDPLDLDGYTGLARSIAALEKVYPFIYKRPYKASALPVFEKLLVLMPVNQYTHALLTKYYFSRKMTAKLHETVGRSIGLYPSLYYQLKNQPFYSMAMNEMIKTSLLSAIDNGVYVEPAYKVLSDLALQEEDYTLAISYFEKTRIVRPYADNSSYDLQLGTLYLQAGRLSDAEQAFVESLKTADKEHRLNSIWNLYSRHEAYSEFLLFCKRVDDTQLTDLIEILRAKCLINMDRYELATSHLVRLNSKKYAAESLYLEARIAEKQKDWDTMELRSQRATVLEPGNRTYHLLFSTALKNQKKWPQAEQAATDAIDATANPESWLYNHRAWIRWSNKNYTGAREDWERAIGLSPKNASLYYGVALVFEQGGNVKAAIRQMNKALALQPDHAGFKKKYNELLKKQ